MHIACYVFLKRYKSHFVAKSKQCKILGRLKGNNNVVKNLTLNSGDLKKLTRLNVPQYQKNSATNYFYAVLSIHKF